MDLALRKNSIVKKLTDGISGLFVANKVKSISGEGKVISEGKVEVTHPDKSTEVIEAKHIIIATGSSPIEIGSAKFDQSDIIDSTGALELTEVPKTLGVIGAGVIGLELGSVWARLGSKVTVIEAMDDFLPMADKDISKETFKEFINQGLDIKLGCKLVASEKIKGGIKITYENKEGSVDMDFDKLVVAVGRRPNSENIFSENLDITLDSRGFINVDDHCQTDATRVE